MRREIGIGLLKNFIGNYIIGLLVTTIMFGGSTLFKVAKGTYNPNFAPPGTIITATFIFPLILAIVAWFLNDKGKLLIEEENNSIILTLKRYYFFKRQTVQCIKLYTNDQVSLVAYNPKRRYASHIYEITTKDKTMEWNLSRTDLFFHRDLLNLFARMLQAHDLNDYQQSKYLYQFTIPITFELEPKASYEKRKQLQKIIIVTIVLVACIAIT